MFTPENDLERSLVSAANDPVARPQFYQAFAASKILFINSGVLLPESVGESTLPTGTKIGIQPIHINGKSYLPIFSSLARLQMFIQKEVSYLQVAVIDFLSLTKAAELILNPGSEYGKEFTRSEIESILNGTVGQPTPYVMKRETQILLGQPANYPHALVEALSQLFKNLMEVESAYLAHFHNPASGEPAHTLIGIKAAGNWEEITAQIGIVLTSIEIPDPPVDVCRIDGSSGTESYFSKTKPFYKRKAFGLF